MDIRAQELLSYTDWERTQWRDWFDGQGRAVLEIQTGGLRHKTVASLIKHIFAVELRYAQRLTGVPLTPYNQIVTESAEQLFELGYESRAAFKDWMNQVRDWNQPFEFNVLDFNVKAPIKKFVIHVLVHEIRHWAQVALLLRAAGYEDLGEHDFINSDAIS